LNEFIDNITRLINAIGPGERISLAKLAVTHLERTARPMRIAVDISIWLFQVQAGRGGRNPELRTLFYRLLKLLALPVHPLFVYDGRQKPSFKRGKAVSARSYGSAPIIRRSKDLIERFRFPWHEAPGEAEAECARLQQAGIVDAVMSNDVDTLMFGSSLTIMNFSKESGSGTSSATHVTCYAMGQDGHPSNIPLGRPGMILFAMLSGGDYLPSGIGKCGSGLAAEIAKAGFGEDLLEELASPSDGNGLKDWRERLQYELDENENGYFKSRHKAVRIPETFPDLAILEYYTQPKVSSDNEMEFLRNRLRQAWDQEIDPLAIRTFAADHFEWNYRTGARKVIKLLAEPLISYRLRLQRPVAGVSPGFSFVPDCPPSMQKVYKSRTNFGTDATPELQFDMLPADVVGLDLLAEEPPPPLATPESMPSQNSVHEGMDDDDLELVAEPAVPTPSKSWVTKRFDPFSLEKVWVFETIARLGVPGAVKKWEKEQAEKAEEAKEAATKKKTGTRRAAPKKKGPIDAGMKRGSILKYGTLTKERSTLSTFKQAHLLETATSGTSSKNPLARLGPGSASSSPISLNQGDDPFSPSIYTQQGASPTMRYVSQQMDDLLESFNSMCNLSPSSNTKRHHITEQSRLRPRRTAIGIDGPEIEEPETLSANSSIRSTGPEGLKISYSSETLFDERSDRKILAPPSPSKKIRAKPRKAVRSELEEENNEVQEIEKAIESLSLSLECETGHDETTLPRPLRQSSLKKAAQEPGPRTRSSKTEIAEPSKSSRKAKFDPHRPSNTIDPPLQTNHAFDEHAVQLSTQTCKNNDKQEANKPPKKSSKKTATTCPKYETKGHVENIVLHDGFWSIDPSPPAQNSSNDPTRANEENTTRRQTQGSKKKRLPRVSILDLV
jgi:Holliday junction resolvase YEN1